VENAVRIIKEKVSLKSDEECVNILNGVSVQVQRRPRQE
jgi:hypothetical protein